MIKAPNFYADKEYAQGLYEIYNDIYFTLKKNEEYLEKAKKAETIKVEYILELSKRIALTEHAPVGWKEGHPFINAFPPTPLPEHMRAGKLSVYNESCSTTTSELSSLPTLIQTNHKIDSKSKVVEKSKAISYMEKLKEQMRSLRESETAQAAAMEEVVQGSAENTAEDSERQSTTRTVTLSFGTFDSDDDDEE